MSLSLTEAERVFKHVDWSDLLESEDGTPFAVLVNGEPTVARVVQTTDDRDDENDRDIAVVVEIDGQYFRKEGYGSVGSHCYGEYTPSWYGLKAVRPRETVVTVYDTI